MTYEGVSLLIALVITGMAVMVAVGLYHIYWMLVDIFDFKMRPKIIHIMISVVSVIAVVLCVMALRYLFPMLATFG